MQLNSINDLRPYYEQSEFQSIDEKNCLAFIKNKTYFNFVSYIRPTVYPFLPKELWLWDFNFINEVTAHRYSYLEDDLDTVDFDSHRESTFKEALYKISPIRKIELGENFNIIQNTLGTPLVLIDFWKFYFKRIGKFNIVGNDQYAHIDLRMRYKIE